MRLVDRSKDFKRRENKGGERDEGRSVEYLTASSNKAFIKSLLSLMSVHRLQLRGCNALLLWCQSDRVADSSVWSLGECFSGLLTWENLPCGSVF